jgi:hypothetical protein
MGHHRKPTPRAQPIKCQKLTATPPARCGWICQGLTSAGRALEIHDSVATVLIREGQRVHARQSRDRSHLKLRVRRSMAAVSIRLSGTGRSGRTDEGLW